jgi:hypothetical protein
MRRLALLALLSSCGVDAGATVAASCPSRSEFDAVSPVLEQRCGTLDCHGALARPLRVYGTYGMRLFDDPSALEPGSGVYADPEGSPTTEAERAANRASLCALEPEIMAAVGAGDLDATELTVLRKATGTEHHKGGVVFHEADGGERCLRSWIEGGVDTSACTSALDPP